MTAELAGAVGALGLALVLAAPGRRWRLAGLAAWAAGLAALLAWLAPGGEVGLLAAVAGIGVVAALALAAAFLRWPWLLPSVAWQLFWETPRAGGVPRRRQLVAGAGLDLGPLALPLALLVGWLGLGLVWSDDPRGGAILLASFVLPFGILAALLARLPWRAGWAATLYGQLALMGLVLASIGIWRYATRDVLWSPPAIDDDTIAPSAWFYRVSPAFSDASLYGRFLVVAILASLVVVLFGRGLAAWAALAAATVTWIGLVPAFSQSSLVALAAGIVVALGARWTGRATVVVGLAAATLAAVALATPDVRDRVVADVALVEAAGSRSPLVTDGMRIALDHPAAGVGTGGFALAYAERTGAAADSPSAPVTVAAENGLPGVVLLAWLAAAALVLTLRRSPAGDARGLARLAVGLALLAILVHSLFYDTLFEDPAFWALLGLAGATAREPA